MPWGIPDVDPPEPEDLMNQVFFPEIDFSEEDLMIILAQKPTVTPLLNTMADAAEQQNPEVVVKLAADLSAYFFDLGKKVGRENA